MTKNLGTRLPHRVLLGTLAAGAFLSITTPAFAASYGSKSSPIRAGGDGDAAFYGSVTKTSTNIWNKYHYRDTAPGGNAAYVDTTWYFYRNASGQGAYWSKDGYDRSSDTRSGSWVYGEDANHLRSDANQGRASTHTCENQRLSPDPCSSRVIKTLSY